MYVELRVTIANMVIDTYLDVSKSDKVAVVKQAKVDEAAERLCECAGQKVPKDYLLMVTYWGGCDVLVVTDDKGNYINEIYR